MDRLVDDLAARIRASRGMAGKRDIAGAVAALGLAPGLGLDAGAAQHLVERFAGRPSVEAAAVEHMLVC